jgi:hypothetical protein
VPIDEEKPEFITEIGQDASRSIQSMVMAATAAGFTSFLEAVQVLPYGVSAAVTELTTGLAIRRAAERMKDMFEYFSNRLREIGEQKVDKEWFRSDEFQTLLYEAIRQLHVTHDREKIEMLGTALANSGASGFKKEERKDLFIRFVRELTREHIRVLIELAPKPLPLNSASPPPGIEPPSDETVRKLMWSRRPILGSGDENLLALQMLHAYGLVQEEITSSISQPSIPTSFRSESQVRSAIREFTKSVETPTIHRSFRLSQLGDEFLRFVGLPKNPVGTE